MADPKMEPLRTALVDGDHAAAVTLTKDLLQAGFDRRMIITDGIEKAMAYLDAKCTVEQFNLLEIMLSGRAVIGVINEMYPPESPQPETGPGVALCSLEGDVHDLGKNIFKMVLTATGYRVVDCGKDCPIDKFIDTAAARDVSILGISGLITTIIPQVRRVREALQQRGLEHVRVIAGGAALKQSTPENLNVDFVAQNAFEGLHYLDDLTGGGHEQP